MALYWFGRESGCRIPLSRKDNVGVQKDTYTVFCAAPILFQKRRLNLVKSYTSNDTVLQHQILLQYCASDGFLLVNMRW